MLVCALTLLNFTSCDNFMRQAVRSMLCCGLCIPMHEISYNFQLCCALFDTAAGKKKNVNVGSKGGSAGLDDYKYDTPLDDADDFM